jgi:hypothetical protein
LKLAYIFRVDLENPGDIYSSPVHYLGHTRSGVIVDVFANDVPEMEVDAAIIGGGALMTNKKFIRNLNGVLEKIHAKHTIVWGVGFDPNNTDIEIKNSFDLFSTREYKLHSDVDWVPCVSALHPVFDQVESVIPTRDFLVVDHFKRSIEFSRPHTRIINRPNDIRTVVQQIASHRFVITSSYHVAYWSMLSGRPCAVVGEGLPSKFKRMKHFPVIADTWNDSLTDLAKTWPDARYESIRANYLYHRKIEELLGIENPLQLASMQHKHLKRDLV